MNDTPPHRPWIRGGLLFLRAVIERVDEEARAARSRGSRPGDVATGGSACSLHDGEVPRVGAQVAEGDLDVVQLARDMLSLR